MPTGGLKAGHSLVRCHVEAGKAGEVFEVVGINQAEANQEKFEVGGGEEGMFGREEK